jgi:pyrrolysine biosynthesis protein PylC
MRLVVVGGSLQGVEATYLAHKAGWEVLLIDKKTQVPASKLCDTFIQLDVTQMEELVPVLKNADIIIPATENPQALNSLVRWNRKGEIPLIFDADAYAISSSKLKSNQLFASIGIPMPLSWPGCGFPIIAKPVDGSGSKGVHLFRHHKQLEKHNSNISPNDWVIQEYLEGPIYSLEVIGNPGNYTTLQVTDLEIDKKYDCKRVSAPSRLSPEQVQQLEQISLRIAEALTLKGIMDVEVIVHNGQMKVLEIDARLPSQTPTAVYWSSGINMLELLEFSHKGHRGHRDIQKPTPAVIYEHIKVISETIEICGEHIMTTGGPLKLYPDFYGADEAITNYSPGQNSWIATLINSGTTLSEAWEKRQQVIKNIRDHFKLKFYKDLTPKNLAIEKNNDYNSFCTQNAFRMSGLDLSNP